VKEKVERENDGVGELKQRADIVSIERTLKKNNLNICCPPAAVPSLFLLLFSPETHSCLSHLAADSHVDHRRQMGW